MTKKETDQQEQREPLPTDLMDLEELLEWMLHNPDSHPDNDLFHAEETDND